MMSDEQIAQLQRRSTEFNEGEQVPGTPYLVVSRIGQGGMGSVYEVEHIELGKRFVLKALLDQFCQRQDLVQRLRNEWKSLGRLEHPNIVSVSDAGLATNGAPFYVMERLQGETLSGALQRLGRFTLGDALRIGAELLDGLQAAHEIGIVHRDVKPPNIFITQYGAAKLLDFGIAKLTDGAAMDLTGRGIAIGTPRYMSPEQAAGERVDGRADLYAVGLVLFEMLSGCGPFDGCESHEVFLAHITRQPPRLGELVAGIPPELDGFVAALLAKRPADRPASAGAAAATLRSMMRTYRTADEMPDTQAEEMAGALTPMVRASYLPPSMPPPAALVSASAYSPFSSPHTVSEDGPTAGVGPGPQFVAAGRRTPSPLQRRASVPPRTPISSAGRSWALAGALPSVAPSTRTAVPGDAVGVAFERTPSPLSNSAPPGTWDVSGSAFKRGRRYTKIAAISFAVVGAAGLAGWLARAPEPSADERAQGTPLAAASNVDLPPAQPETDQPQPQPSSDDPTRAHKEGAHLGTAADASRRDLADIAAAKEQSGLSPLSQGERDTADREKPRARRTTRVPQTPRPEATPAIEVPKQPAYEAPVRPIVAVPQAAPSPKPPSIAPPAEPAAPTPNSKTGLPRPGIPGSGLPGSGLPGSG